MNILILLAAGKSKRFGADKILAEIAGKPMILYSIKTFTSIADKILIVANKNNITRLRTLAPAAKIILGAKTRQESAGRAIRFLAKNRSAKFRPAPNDLIIIHNAANPFATKQEVGKCLALAKKHGACIVGHKPIDTVKIVRGRFVEKTLSRDKILFAQTPQIFKWEILRSSYNNTKKQTFTDDASMVEAAGHKIVWTQASYANKKITRPFAAGEHRSIKQAVAERHHFAENAPLKTLIGIGSDSHKFSKDRSPQANTGLSNKLSRSDTIPGALTLGGLKFPHYRKLKADSDGDAILHAIATAISSALGGGSLGTFATPMREAGIKNSRKYLEFILKKCAAQKYKISNLSINIETQKIKIDPITSKLKKSLARILSLDKDKIGITAIRGKSKNNFYCASAVILKFF